MSGNQIRLDPETRLRDIAKDILTGIETAMAKEMKKPSWGARQKVELRRLIRYRLEQAIQSYVVCGLQPRCHLSTSVGNEEWNRPLITTKEHILLLTQALPNLSISLASEIFDKFFPQAADRVWLKLKPELDRVIDESIKPVLYDNPYCENCPLCTQKTEQSPWTYKKCGNGD